MAGRTLRAQVREEITGQIRSVARRHLATDGANLSLRAVARDIGMVPSALYRYFPSRDALLTALITDAYEGLAGAAEAAEAAVPRGHLRDRWLALCRAVRAWALANPAEYALIYGSPVPGYAAPPDTVAPASRVVMCVVEILFANAAASPPDHRPGPPLPAALRANLRQLLDSRPDVTPPATDPESVLATVLALWTQLFGLVNFEVFGRLNDLIDARDEYFDHQVRLLADWAGLGEPRAPAR
ncbi:MAG: TetR/AcrR family transcriptional regulator [Streptomycetaceae bacterium]|nr:TetR/AcrR family transcriptional regulator [Streptomycetaceae bacterium]